MSILKVAVVIVTYNRSSVIQETLNCIQAQKYPLSYIVVVDNNSTDNTIEELSKRVALDNRIIVLNSPSNIGFGAGLALGMNWVLSNCDSDYIWLMDDDSYSIPDTLEYLMDNMVANNCDALGLLGYKLGLGTKKYINPERITEDLDFMPIDHSLFSTKMIKKIGLPRDYYFMMCEDYEYCLRIKKEGFRLSVLANNYVQRLAMGGGQRFSRSTSWRGYYHSRNHLLILKEYFSWFRLASYIIVQSKYLIAGLQAKDRKKRIWFRLLGIYHGLLGIKGKTLDPKTLTFLS